MKHEAHYRLFGQMQVWQLVAALIFGWNAHVFWDEWTSWNLVSFACQIVILACVWRQIRSWEEPVTRWISIFMRRFER